MEMSLQVSPWTANKLPIMMKKWSRQKSYKHRTILCKTTTNEVAFRKKMNFYEVLSLGSQNVGFDEIKKAYRGMALQYHPDVCPPSAKEESTKRFVELQKAYETLSDPIARRMYDLELRMVNSVGFAFEGLPSEDRKSSFPREVWERQLHGLYQRSYARVERRNNGYTHVKVI
jgi:curved DNA-binding protein CbpA